MTSKIIRCRLCRKHPKAKEDIHGVWLGCGCCVCVWGPYLPEAETLWNRLMRIKR